MPAARPLSGCAQVLQRLLGSDAQHAAGGWQAGRAIAGMWRYGGRRFSAVGGSAWYCATGWRADEVLLTRREASGRVSLDRAIPCVSRANA